jgi:uncharacterized protein (TIGR02246 family)
MSPDKRAVREVHLTWIEAVNAGELDRLLGMITDDVVLINPEGAPIGREGFSAKFAGAQEEWRIECRSELEEVVVAGDLAYTRSRDAVSVTPRAGGETTELAGYRLTVYRRQPEGRWLLARDAHTVSSVEK